MFQEKNNYLVQSCTPTCVLRFKKMSYTVCLNPYVLDFKALILVLKMGVPLLVHKIESSHTKKVLFRKHNFRNLTLFLILRVMLTWCSIK